MPGPESGPGGPQGKPFREREKQKYDPQLDDLNRLLNQEPKTGGEVVPYNKQNVNSSPSSAAAPEVQGASAPAYSGSVESSSASAVGAVGASSLDMGGSGGGVATLERPAVHAQAQTSTELDTGSAPPGGGLDIDPKPKGATFRVVFTGMDESAKGYAREAAHEELSKKREGPFWKRMVKSAWHNITREYQVVKKTNEKYQEMVEENNILHHQGLDDTQMREATVMRYGSEYAEHIMHDGETFHKLNSPEAASDPNAQRINEDVQDLMRRTARGEFADDDSLKMEMERIVEAWRNENISQDYIGEGQFMASNLAEKCRELEALVSSAEGLSALDRDALIEQHVSGVEVVAGEARVGSRTEIDSRLSERLAEKLRKVPLAKLIGEERMARLVATVGNETTIAAMVSGGTYFLKRGAAAAGKIIAPGIGSGIVAGVREYHALQDERNLEARRADSEMEEPETTDGSEKSRTRRILNKFGFAKSSEEYRAELTATLYEAKPASELLDELGGLYTETGELNITNREQLDEAMRIMGEMRARIRIGDRTGARLINYTEGDVEGMEHNRFDLDLAMAKLETDIVKLYKDPIAHGMLDINPDEENFADKFNEQIDFGEAKLMGEMKAKDRLFRKLVAKRVFKRVIASTFMGAAIGGAVKYGAEAAREAYNSVRETFSGMFGDQAPAMEFAAYETSDGSTPGHAGSPTSTEATPGHAGTPTDTEATPGHAGTPTGSEATPDHAGTSASGAEGTPGHAGTPENINTGESVQVTDTSKFNLPEGYKAEVDGKTVTVTGPDGTQYGGLEVTQDGALSDSAIESLKSHGFNVTESHEIVPGKPEITKTEVDARQFVDNHREEMVKIHHTKWFDNNTSRYDLNELGLSNRMDAQGNIIADISGMTKGGSFHGASGVNWHEAAKDGHLKLYLSASRGTQSHAFEFTVRPDGTVAIDKDSPAAALFDEHGKFIGGFQEVALTGDKAADGGENIATLATVVGEKHGGTFTDTVKTPTVQTNHTYTITPPVQPAAYTVPTDHTIPFVPVTGRRRVGDAQRRSPRLPTPPDGIAPVTPIGPDVALPALGAAPETRDEEAEARAASFGLGAAPTAEADSATPNQQQPDATGNPDTGPVNPNQQANPDAGGDADDNEADNNDNEQQEDNEGFTDAEKHMLAEIDAEARTLPAELDKGMLNGLSPRERKLVIRLVHEAMRATPRGTAENKFGYARRLTRTLQVGASTGRATRLPLMSPAMQRVATRAFAALDNARVSTGSSSGQAA